MQSVNFREYASDDVSIVITMTDSNDAAIDITGYVFYFTLKTNVDDAVALLSKTVSVHTNPTGGITTITLDADDTDTFLGDYYYDIRYKDTSDKVHTVCTGIFTFKRSIKGKITL